MSETKEQREARVRRWANYREKCRICGLLQVNVVHEPDPDNAPEGREYYEAMRDEMHTFQPSGIYGDHEPGKGSWSDLHGWSADTPDPRPEPPPSELTAEEQIIRDWLAGQLGPSGAPLPPSRRLSQPLPRRQVTAVIATLIDLLDAARAAPQADAGRLRWTDVRKAITDSYYDTRNEGGTMEQAADRAATRVMNLRSQAASPAAPAGLDVEQLARAIDETPTLVNWRVDKGDRYEAVKVWAADIAAEYDRLAASQPSEEGPADEGAGGTHEHGPLSWHETPNLMAWRCDVCGTFPVDIR